MGSQMVAPAVLLLCALHVADSLYLQSQPGNSTGDGPDTIIVPMGHNGQTKDAVLASAYNYPPATGRNFLCSLRRTGFTGDIILFMGSHEARPPFVKAYGVITRDLPERADGSVTDDRIVGRVAQIQECRNGGYRYCMLSDYRDVFFQRNPFLDFPAGQDLVFAEEKATQGTIGSNRHNFKWMRNCLKHQNLKKAMYQTIWNRNVVCSGTIVGTPAGLTALSEAIHTATAQLPFCSGGPMDQALLNVILHWAEAAPSQVPSLESLRMQIQGARNGIINTLGFAEDLPRSPQGEVLESDGKTVSAVIHQYDRFTGKFGLADWVNASMQSCDGFDS